MKTKFTRKSLSGLSPFFCAVLSLTIMFTSCDQEELIEPTNLLDVSSAVGDVVSITNPGFESSKTGWSDESDLAISTSDVNSGSRAAKITSSSQKFQQTVSVSANTNFTLSAYVLDKGTIGATVGGTTYDNGGDYGDFTKVSVSFNSGSSTSVTIFGEYNGGEGRFDDFELIEGTSTSTGGERHQEMVGKTVRIENVSSNLWAQISSNADEAAVRVNAQTFTGSWTKWVVEEVNVDETYYYRFKNVASNRRLRPNGGGETNIEIGSTTSTGTWTQWAITSDGSGNYVFKNRAFSTYLNGAGSSAQTTMTATSSTDGDLTTWRIEDVDTGEDANGESTPDTDVCTFGNSAIPAGNLAYGKSTSQSSLYTGAGGESCKAVDGNTSGNWGTGSVTHTQDESQPWWEVDLGSNESVGDIVIYNRTNCSCSTRLKDFTVSVINSSGSTTFSQFISDSPSQSVTVDADGATGRTIRVQLSGSDPLSLAEVQVFEHEDTQGTTDLDPNKAPGENFDLSKWKITLSSADEKTPEDLIGGYELSNQFYTDPSDGGMVFKNYPKGAGTTTSSTYSRVELREMLRGTEDWWDATYPNEDYPNTSDLMNNWVFSSSSAGTQSDAAGVDGTMTATLMVNSVTESSSSSSQNGRIIIGQIHAAGNEPIRLYYHKQPNHQNGAIYYAHEPNSGNERYYNILGSGYVDECDCNSAGDFENVGNPSDGIGLNEEFSYKIKVVGNLLEVFIYDENGSQIGYDDRDMSNSGFENEYMYFKAGVYSGDKSTQDSDDFQQVTFYTLDVTHD